MEADFEDSFFFEDRFDEDDAAGRLAAGVEASATEVDALEAELVESATDGAGSSASSFVATEASGFAAVSEELLE